MKERFDAIYTAALADILDARGLRQQTLPPAIRPLERGMRTAGPAFTVQGTPAESPDGPAYDAALARCSGCWETSRPGTSRSMRALNTSPPTSASCPSRPWKARGVAGCVLDGGCRDIGFILDEASPVYCRFVTPEDSTWRWQLEATRVPVEIDGVRVEPEDWIVGDDDGVVVVPGAIAEEVLAEAEAKAATESEIRVAVRNGMSPLEAYERYGTF